MTTGVAWSFLIAAGGSGSRLGGKPKQFLSLQGRALWRWSFDVADSLRKRGLLRDIVLVVPRGYEKHYAQSAKELTLTITQGGASRAESVQNGLKKCSGSHVLVHDGARPFITEELCEELMTAAEKTGGAVPLLPSTDSLKKIENGTMTQEDRSLYFRTQTPQAFDKALLSAALDDAGVGATDEASAWLAAGRKLAHVAGLDRNFKVTTPFDWEMAKSMTEKLVEKRTGHGYDIHQLAAGRPLIIAGVEIKDTGYGLLGHSDADIVAHTVMDAMLGAAGEPDIGTLFPASSEKFRGADSIELLRLVLERLAAKGWRPEWIDATLNAQIPKLGALVPAFIEKMNKELGAAPGERLFNIKVKSAEHCGSAGRSECMICHAVATISRTSAC